MFRFVLRFFAFIAASALILPALFSATELRLANGDTLHGEHVKTENGVIHFKSPVLGTLLVPASEAQVVNIADTPVESLVGLPPVKAPPPALPQTTSPKTSTDTGTLVVKTPVAPSPASTGPIAKPRWKGKIEFGYQQQSGRKEAINGSLRIDVETTAKSDDLLKASARALYGRQNGVTNSERYETSFRWRHELTDRMFTQSLTSYYTDRVKHIDHNFEQNVGLGYRFIDRKRHILNAGLGGTGQYREALGVAEDIIYLSEFFQDYSYKINGRLSFLQEASALYSTKPVFHGIAPADNYRIRFNSALQGKVSERVSLNIRYEYEYDSTVSNPALRTDKRVTSSIGYAL